VTTVLLDTHVVQWWSAEPERLSETATKTLAEADQLAVAAISWFELAWLAAHERIICESLGAVLGIAVRLRRPASRHDPERIRRPSGLPW
jgi:hypothetical protein